MSKTPPIPVPAGHKFCFGCSAALPLDAFHRRKGRADGRSAPCKACVKAAQPRYRQMGQLFAETMDRMQRRSEEIRRRPSGR